MRYNVKVFNVRVPVPGFGMIPVGDVELKDVTGDVASAIVILCEAARLHGKIAAIEPTLVDEAVLAARLKVLAILKS